MSLPAILALVALGIAAGIVAWLLWRGRNGWPSLPAWDWHDIRKNVALVATIIGAAVLTAMAWGLLNELVIMAKGLIGDLLHHTGKNPPPKEVGTSLETIISAIAWGLKLLLGGVVVVLLSLGFVITPRHFEFAGPGGIKAGFSGGDEAAAKAAGAKEVAVAAEAKAEEVVAEAKAAAPVPAPAAEPLPDYAR